MADTDQTRTTPALPVPDVLPLLSRGRHRRPRSGACFMEMASYLAGERWSDHPACTSPVLAALARSVNDRTSDQGRSRLGLLVPRVIGLVGDDPRLEARLALRCAATALPLVAEDRQRVMAVAVLSSQQQLAALGAPADGELAETAAAALAGAPHAVAWARGFTTTMPPSSRRDRHRGAEHVAASAAVGIGLACLPGGQVEVDAVLHDLLATAIADVEAWTGRRPGARGPVDAAAWEQACRLTTAGR